MKMVTRLLAKNIVDCDLDQIPEEAVHESKKCFLNWLGCAIGAHRHPSIGMMLRVAEEMNSSPQATLLGTSIKTDLQFAAILNGMTSSMFDYDDTFLDTIIHPSAPVFPALLAWCEYKNLPGKRLLQNFIVGVEVEERIGLLLGRKGHYERGWHITGTAGTFGATAAIGKIIGLSEEKMAYALGIASTQPVGIREMFGTFTKPIHAGKAAANGILSALLAREGLTSSTRPLEAEKGYAHLVSESPDFSFLEENWTNQWLIMKNSYKPYACGIVAHPAIDAAIRLRDRGIQADEIARITIVVHPLALELTGKREPQDNLQAIFSVYHGVAVGLLDGKAGQWQYATERVLDHKVIDLRKKITAVTGDLHVDQAILKAELITGQIITEFVEQTLGSLEKPLNDRDLEGKFRDLTSPYVSKKNQEKIIELVWKLDQQSNISNMIELCRADV